MKKFLAVFVIGLCLSTAAVFAQHSNKFGIGLQGGWAGGVGGGLSLKLPSVPLFWTIDADNNWLGVAGDFYFIDKSLVPEAKLGWYFGVGVYGDLGFWGDHDDSFGLIVGGRLPIGLSWQPLNWFELYLQVVPNIGLQISPDIGLGGNFFGANLGIRLWL
jgi:hypothetical protein